MPLTVYFLHDELAPRNVRMRWDDAQNPPRVGELVDHHGNGREGTVWRVTDVVWTSAHSAEVFVTDAPKPANYR